MTQQTLTEWKKGTQKDCFLALHSAAARALAVVLMMTVMLLGRPAPVWAQDTIMPLLSNSTATPSCIPAAGGSIALQVTATDNGPQDSGVQQVYADVY